MKDRINNTQATAKIAMVSLGCTKNLVDAEVMLGLLNESGYQITGVESEADIIIVNTCGFINPAKEEAINMILEMNTYKTEGKCKGLIVTGCLMQRYEEELLREMPEIDAALGTGEFNHIVDTVDKVLAGEREVNVNKPSFIYDHTYPRILTTPQYMAYVKIAEGCDNRCAYCVIPQLRGPFRSRSIPSIVEETKHLVEQGVKEINLIAQDTTAYGIDYYGHYALTQLLQELIKIKDLEWIRLLYSYPNRFTSELIELIGKEPKICSYIDLPLQHISSHVLTEMKRKGTPEEVRMLIQKLREMIPNVSLRTSFIVGFPGETEADFQELLDFMREIKFDRVGVFPYSQEEGTIAGEREDQIEEEIKQERYHMAMQLQQEISRAKNKEWVGRKINVLVEGNNAENAEILVGRSQRDAPDIDGLIYMTKGEAKSGDMVCVKIIDSDEYDLYGEIVENELS